MFDESKLTKESSKDLRLLEEAINALDLQAFLSISNTNESYISAKYKILEQLYDLEEEAYDSFAPVIDDDSSDHNKENRVNALLGVSEIYQSVAANWCKVLTYGRSFQDVIAKDSSMRFLLRVKVIHFLGIGNRFLYKAICDQHKYFTSFDVVDQEWFNRYLKSQLWYMTIRWYLGDKNYLPLEQQNLKHIDELMQKVFTVEARRKNYTNALTDDIGMPIELRDYCYNLAEMLVPTARQVYSPTLNLYKYVKSALALTEANDGIVLKRPTLSSPAILEPNKEQLANTIRAKFTESNLTKQSYKDKALIVYALEALDLQEFCEHNNSVKSKILSILLFEEINLCSEHPNPTDNFGVAQSEALLKAFKAYRTLACKWLSILAFSRTSQELLAPNSQLRFLLIAKVVELFEVSTQYLLSLLLSKQKSDELSEEMYRSFCVLYLNQQLWLVALNRKLNMKQEVQQGISLMRAVNNLMLQRLPPNQTQVIYAYALRDSHIPHNVRAIYGHLAGIDEYQLQDEKNPGRLNIESFLAFIEKTIDEESIQPPLTMMYAQFNDVINSPSRETIRRKRADVTLASLQSDLPRLSL